MDNHPKVFISYSHDNEAHKSWVLKLATHLRQHMGVDVILDQWNLRIGSDLGLYMEQGLSTAALVVCVCSDDYVWKANSGVRGTGYEKMIMTQAMMKDTNSDYIIPIIRNNSEKKMPVFLGTKLYIDFSDDETYLEKLSDLSARIYNEDIAKKPPLGISPFDKRMSSFVDMKNALVAALYHDPAMKGNVSFNFSNNSKMFTIGSGEYEFKTRWSECGSDSIYAYRDSVKQIGYTSRQTVFPSVEQLKDFDYTSRTRKVYVGEVVIWVNGHGNFAATKVTNIQVKSRGADEDLLEFEYIIYC